MKILIADNLNESAVTLLTDGGFQVSVQPMLKDDYLVSTLKSMQPQILIVRSTKVTAAMCEATDSLELIIRAGAGVNNIDLEAASQNAICVSNCPGMNAVAVAELTLAHLLNADRRLYENIQTAREGQWAKKSLSPGRGLKGTRLGILGFGAIGKAVAMRARALDMEVVAWSGSMTDEVARAYDIKWCADPTVLAKISDAVSIHLPLSDATRGLIDANFISKMKDKALLINTARAEIIDEEALVKALETQRIRAALDVISDEPKTDGPLSHKLIGQPNLYLSHHIGASTNQAQIAVAQEAAKVALTFRDEGRAEHCVNMAVQTQATHLLVVRHFDRVGVLAKILDVLKSAAINIQGMSNEIFQGNEGAACARIQLSNAPSLQVSAELSALDDVISYTIVGVRK
ncbi:MAG: NAD(P)-dependent oxidoreductase [Bradymonadia bacterium]